MNNDLKASDHVERARLFFGLARYDEALAACRQRPRSCPITRCAPVAGSRR